GAGGSLLFPLFSPLFTLLLPLPSYLGWPASPAPRGGGALAERLGASVTLIHVWDAEAVGAPPATLGWSAGQQQRLVESLRRHIDEGMEAARAAIPAGVPVDVVVLEDSAPAEAIARYGEANGYDLIVISTHGRTGVRRLFLGSVTEKVVRLARLPVLTVPAA
ncbi:MAG: universal stress protein, partial [Sandaracinaceae bacterium]